MRTPRALVNRIVRKSPGITASRLLTRTSGIYTSVTIKRVTKAVVLAGEAVKEGDKLYKAERQE